MKNVTLTSGKTCALDPRSLIGSGGEAEIYDIGNSQVFKLLKDPNHADFVGDLEGQRGAKARIDEHQKKLPEFLKLRLPPRVIGPIEVGKFRDRIVGYSMKHIQFTDPLLRYSERGFREQHPQFTNTDVTRIMHDLHETVNDLHQSQIVIGDFNDLNVLVDKTITIVDADSMQFGSFLSKLYTERFVDPILCSSTGLNLTKPHTIYSDWYAFAIMLMQVNLFVHPYGGIYKPSDPTKRVPASERPLRRISVFHTDVQLPKPARSLDCLPVDLAHHLFQTFEQDLRIEFPKILLDIHWADCPSCGYLHARSSCPNCSKPHPTVKQTVEIRGKVTATTVFQTKGTILYVRPYSGMSWIYRDGQVFRNKFTNKVGPVISVDKFGLVNDEIFSGHGSRVVKHEETSYVPYITVDTYKNKSCFDTNGVDFYFLQGGNLYQKSQSELKPNRFIGTVLLNQTQLWVGKTFGFCFYQAGEMSTGYIFNATVGSLKELSLPHIAGEIVSCACQFTDTIVYFQVKVQHKGKFKYHLFIIHQKGELLTHLEGDETVNEWIAKVPNAAALANFLYVPSDEGLLRIDFNPQNSTLTKAREYPDTEPWVSSDSKIIIASDGLYTINHDSITKLLLN